MISHRRALDIINARFGSHPGYRALHAKGVLLKGTFTATPEAARLTRAQHMQGEATLNNAIRTCVCTGNKCQTCANNFCASDGGQPSMQCQACALGTLNPDGGACFGPVSSACSMNADCVAYIQCTNGCP